MDSNSYRGSLRHISGNRQSSLNKQDYNITEEELYERRKQQELRKQIQQKEQELEKLSNNKERGHRVQVHTWNQPQKSDESGQRSRFDKTPPQRLGQNSPLRKKSGSHSRSPNRDRNR